MGIKSSNVTAYSRIPFCRIFYLQVVNKSQRPAGFSLHLGWCHVTERPWSHNPTTTTAPSSRLQAVNPPLIPTSPPSLPYLPLSLLGALDKADHSQPHDSPTGALDQVS